MICKNCNIFFKSLIKIDGKLRNLAHRKYCLECSPFGSHNTRKIEKEREETRNCDQCQKLYKKGHRSYKKICQSCRATNYRKNVKKELIEYFGGKCKICKYDKCVAALEFHHLDPKKKEHAVNISHGSFKKSLVEAKKCILLCCRCHRELHAGFVTLQDILEVK